MKPLVKGDYVLATKFSDGDPCDHFVVGFFDRLHDDRYIVLDEHGESFRFSGFRRCEKVSRRVGEAMVAIMPIIGDHPGKSVWGWRRNAKAMEQLANNRRSKL